MITTGRPALIAPQISISISCMSNNLIKPALHLKVRPQQSLGSLGAHVLGQAVHLPTETDQFQPVWVFASTPPFGDRRQLGQTLFSPLCILLFPLLDRSFVFLLFPDQVSLQVGDVVVLMCVQREGVKGVGKVVWQRGREGVDEG